jgi:hypothetical protein
MVWTKEGALGITINGGNSEALNELESFIRKIKDAHPNLEITDWDSGDDLSDDFLDNRQN